MMLQDEISNENKHAHAIDIYMQCAAADQKRRSQGRSSGSESGSSSVSLSLSAPKKSE